MKKLATPKASRLVAKVRDYAGQRSQRELTRLFGRAGQQRLKAKDGRRLRAPKFWQRWEIELLLGKVPDAEVARRTGRTRGAIQVKREKLRILYVPMRDWPENELRLLGKYSDREVARMTQRTLASVQSKRQDLKLPSATCVQRDWTKQEDALLGKHSDREIARRLQRSYSSVQHRRQRLGIPRPNLLALPWSELEDSLLGRLPDVVLSRQLNRTLAAVRFRRCDRKIPPCISLPDQWRSEIAKLRPALRQVRLEKRKRTTRTVKPVSRFRRRGRDSRPRTLRRWTAAEDKLLGTVPDAELARRLERSEISVMRRRLRMGIFVPGRTKLWTSEDDALVGTMPDGELARKINRTLQAVKVRRQQKGLLPFHASRATTNEE